MRTHSGVDRSDAERLIVFVSSVETGWNLDYRVNELASTQLRGDEGEAHLAAGVVDVEVDEYERLPSA